MSSLYDDIEPTKETLERFKCEPTGVLASDTGRMRWYLTCRLCGEGVHPGTTNPNAWGDSHDCKSTPNSEQETLLGFARWLQEMNLVNANDDAPSTLVEAYLDEK